MLGDRKKSDFVGIYYGLIDTTSLTKDTSWNEYRKKKINFSI